MTMTQRGGVAVMTSDDWDAGREMGLLTGDREARCMVGYGRYGTALIGTNGDDDGTG